MSKAIEVFTDILMDCQALEYFRNNQTIQRKVWDREFSSITRKKFIDLGFVQVTPNVCYLTHEGLEVIGYKEATA